jgi:hypothetical protein
MSFKKLYLYLLETELFDEVMYFLADEKGTIC